MLLVTGVGVAVRAPLARVSENTLKCAGGALLTAFGTFWGVEGTSASWPGADVALVVVIATVAVMAVVAVWWLRRIYASAAGDHDGVAATATASRS